VFPEPFRRTEEAVYNFPSNMFGIALHQYNTHARPDRFQYMAGHELGHAIGLNDLPSACPVNLSIMHNRGQDEPPSTPTFKDSIGIARLKRSRM